MNARGIVGACIVLAAVIVSGGCAYNWDALDPAVGPDASSGCSAQQLDCDGNPGNGCETDTQRSAEHCGACNTRCPTNLANGAAICSAGVCGVTCTAGFSDCDGTVSNGCELPTSADIAHCGSCAQVCGGANATPMCVDSRCTSVCSTGFADCDADTGNGCETDTLTNRVHCGGCDRRCTGATRNCTGGMCVN